MEMLILNDGTELDGRIVPNGDNQIIFVYLYGKTLVEGVMLLADTDKSCKITALYRETEKVYEGYTEIRSASHEFENCSLVMRKPA